MAQVPSEEQQAVNEEDTDITLEKPKPEKKKKIRRGGQIVSGTLRSIFGIESKKKNNVQMIGDGNLLYISGNFIIEHNVISRQQTYINGRNKGFGALAVHPGGKRIAVGERGIRPRILIYTYPEFEIVHTLYEGTESGFTALTFDKAGKRLASVGTYPDFLLTIWDWDEERIILKNKAFSQEIFTVHFSPFQIGRVTTSGVGHIRFWKMESTFTGLKLKGDIGKFGAVELTDIVGFAEFSNGQTLSGSESGHLLLWEAGLLKAQYGRSEGRGCHDGAVETLHLDTYGKMLITGGLDGCVRWWFRAHFEAEVLNSQDVVIIKPLKEIQLGNQFPIKMLIPCRESWVVQCFNGALAKLDFKDDFVTKILEVPADRINGIALMGGNGGELSIQQLKGIGAGIVSQDGKAYLYDCNKRRLAAYRQFESAPTAICFCPSESDQQGKRIIIGALDGSIKIVEITIPEELPQPPEPEPEPEIKIEIKKRRKRRRKKKNQGEEQDGEEQEQQQEQQLSQEEIEKLKEQERIEEEERQQKELEELRLNEEKRKREEIKEKFLVSPPVPTMNIIMSLKPHLQRINTISISPVRINDINGNKVRVMVSGSDDATVFFYSLQQEVEYTGPVGFVRVSSAVVSLNWPQINENQDFITPNGFENEYQQQLGNNNNNNKDINEQQISESGRQQEQDQMQLDSSISQQQQSEQSKKGQLNQVPRLSYIPNALYVIATCSDGSIHEIPIPPIIIREKTAETFILDGPQGFEPQDSYYYGSNSQLGNTIDEIGTLGFTQLLQSSDSPKIGQGSPKMQQLQIDTSKKDKQQQFQIIKPIGIHSPYHNPIFTLTARFPYETAINEVIDHDNKVLRDKLMQEHYERLKKEAEQNVDDLQQLLGDDQEQDQDEDEEQIKKKEEEEKKKEEEERKKKEQEDEEGELEGEGEEEQNKEDQDQGPRRTPAEEMMWEKAKVIVDGLMPKLEIKSGAKMLGCHIIDCGTDFGFIKVALVGGSKQGGIYLFSGRRGDELEQQSEQQEKEQKIKEEQAQLAKFEKKRRRRILKDLDQEGIYGEQAEQIVKEKLLEEEQQRINSKPKEEIIIKQGVEGLGIKQIRNSITTGVYRIQGLTSYCFSQGYGILATGDEEGRIMLHMFIREAQIPQEGHQLLSTMVPIWGTHAHNSQVTSISFISSGRLISGAQDGTVMVFDIGTKELAKQSDLRREAQLLRLLKNKNKNKKNKQKQENEQEQEKEEEIIKKQIIREKTLKILIDETRNLAIPIVPRKDVQYEQILPTLTDQDLRQYKELQEDVYEVTGIERDQQQKEPNQYKLPNADFSYEIGQAIPPPKIIIEGEEEEEEEEEEDEEEEQEEDDDGEWEYEDEEDVVEEEVNQQQEKPKVQLPGGKQVWKRAIEAIQLGLTNSDEEDEKELEEAEKQEQKWVEGMEGQDQQQQQSKRDSIGNKEQLENELEDKEIAQLRKGTCFQTYLAPIKCSTLSIPKVVYQVEHPKSIDLVKDIPKGEFCLEEARRKQEEIQNQKDAEERKQGTKQRVQKIREQFVKYQQKNQMAPEFARIKPEELEVDPTLKSYMSKQSEEILVKIRREALNRTINASIGLQKVKARYLDNIDGLRITIKGFKNQHKVSSFRTTKLPLKIELQAKLLMQKAQQQQQQQLLKLQQQAQQQQYQTMRGKQKNQKEQQQIQLSATLKASQDKDKQGSVMSEHSITNIELKKKKKKKKKEKLRGKMAAIVKQEERERRKAIRAQEWAQHYSKQPKYPDPQQLVGKNGQDEVPGSEIFEPEDQKRIEKAQNSIGVQKLKTESDFVVAEQDRPNKEKKEREIMFHQYGIHGVQQRFNEFLLKLREEKVKLIRKLREIAFRVHNISRDIGEAIVVFTPKFDGEEFPEKMLEVSDQDIKLYEQRLQQKQQQADEEAKRK
ncbi:MAG: putative Cilia- and flagella-associated protein 44, partial [Streblomastix strix]